MRHGDRQELNVTPKASASLPILSRKTLQDDVELLRKTCEHTGFFYLVPWSRPFLGRNRIPLGRLIVYLPRFNGKNQPSIVGKYTIYMDGMGVFLWLKLTFL